MIIFLIGFMGSGKSTIGRRIARRLGYDFLDMDSEIETAQGMSIGKIFELRGEEAFRQMEADFLKTLSAENNTIVAVGGGAPCVGGNMTEILRRGRAVYFKMSPEVLFRRLEKGRARRPKLAGLNDGQLREYIATMLEAREPYYNRASLIIDCNGVSDEYIARHIIFYIESLCENGHNNG